MVQPTVSQGGPHNQAFDAKPNLYCKGIAQREGVDKRTNSNTATQTGCQLKYQFLVE